MVCGYVNSVVIVAVYFGLLDLLVCLLVIAFICLGIYFTVKRFDVCCCLWLDCLALVGVVAICALLAFLVCLVVWYFVGFG